MAKRRESTFTVTFFGAKRLNNSTSGNPRWQLSTSQGTFKTKADAQVGSDLNNYISGPDSLIGRQVVLTMDGEGVFKIDTGN